MCLSLRLDKCSLAGCIVRNYGSDGLARANQCRFCCPLCAPETPKACKAPATALCQSSARANPKYSRVSTPTHAQLRENGTEPASRPGIHIKRAVPDGSALCSAREKRGRGSATCPSTATDATSCSGTAGDRALRSGAAGAAPRMSGGDEEVASSAKGDDCNAAEPSGGCQSRSTSSLTPCDFCGDHRHSMHPHRR